MTALGRAFGAEGGRLIYWIRFFAVVAIVVLVVLSWWFVRQHGPDDLFFRLGVPLLIAFFPQDLFFAISNDLLSPVLGIVVVILSLDLLRSEVPGAVLVVGTGLAAAVAVLTKITNLPVTLVPALIVAIRLWQARARCGVIREAVRMSPLVAAAVIPVGLWMVRNVVLVGDLTASAGKVNHFGITKVPLLQRLHHPLFTPSGFADFIGGLCKTFWRGEFIWYNELLANHSADAVYCATTGVFLFAAAAAAWRDARRGMPVHRADGPGWILLLSSIALLAMLSVSFDYGVCPNPSRDHPYFTLGRLITSALVPFSFLYLRGIDALTSAFHVRPWRWPILLAVVATATGSEIALSWNVFPSAYNWFHLP